MRAAGYNRLRFRGHNLIHRAATIEFRSYKSIGWILVLTIVGTHAFFLWSIRNRIARADADFTIFFTAGKILRERHGADLYDPRIQQEIQAEFSSDADTRKGPLPYIHPPYEALLFVPLTLLPYRAAFIVWECLNLAMLFVICVLLRNSLSSFANIHVWQLFVLCLAFFPVLANFHQGQDAILLLLLVVIAFRCLEREENFLAGCWLGLGIFKYHLILPLALVLAVWKGRKLLLGLVSVAAAVGIVSLGIVGWHGVLQYPGYAWRVVSQPIFGGLPFRRLPNLLGLIGGWPLMERASVLRQVLVASVSIVLLVVTVLMRDKKRDGKSFRLCFSCALIMAVLLGYSTNTYDLCLLILALALSADYWMTTASDTFWSRSLSIFPATVISLSPVWFFLWMRWERINLMAFFLLWWFFAIRRDFLAPQPKREAPKRLAPI